MPKNWCVCGGGEELHPPLFHPRNFHFLDGFTQITKFFIYIRNPQKILKPGVAKNYLSERDYVY